MCNYVGSGCLVYLVGVIGVAADELNMSERAGTFSLHMYDERKHFWLLNNQRVGCYIILSKPFKTTLLWNEDIIAASQAEFDTRLD